MKVLLDEYLPFALCDALRQEHYDVEHLTRLGARGMLDAGLHERLAKEALVFLTHDSEFEDLAGEWPAQIVIAGLPQHVPPGRRLANWLQAMKRIRDRKLPQKLFELMPDGQLFPWDIYEWGRVLRLERDAD